MSSCGPWSPGSRLVLPPSCDDWGSRETAPGEAVEPLDCHLVPLEPVVAPMLEPRECNDLGPAAEAGVATHGTLCFWHKVQLLRLDSR